MPCVFPRHLADVPELAARFPGMTFVIDHLAPGNLAAKHGEQILAATAVRLSRRGAAVVAGGPS